MQLPTRKSTKQRNAMRKNGPIHLTPAGIKEMHDEMEKIKMDIPAVREEVISTREMGDLSENAGYQIAKGNMRRMQNRLMVLQERLKRVVEIKPSNADTVQLGTEVTLSMNGNEHIFYIVGPTESNPLEKRISMLSPLGKILMSKKVGDEVELKRESDSVFYKILKIAIK